MISVCEVNQAKIVDWGNTIDSFIRCKCKIIGADEGYSCRSYANAKQCKN